MASHCTPELVSRTVLVNDVTHSATWCCVKHNSRAKLVLRGENWLTLLFVFLGADHF